MSKFPLEFPAQWCVYPQTPENWQVYLDGRVRYYTDIINSGLNTPYASTGTPVSDLHGFTTIPTMLSNIGNAYGIPGMRGGLEALLLGAYYLGAQRAADYYTNNWG